MERLDVDQSYAAAELMDLSGFDIDMDLEPYQNLDMAVHGFSVNGNQWNPDSFGEGGITEWPSIDEINKATQMIEV